MLDRRLHHPHARARQRGFNFAEVLFAIFILAIGFIMIAAIFPVALVQTKITQEESSGASIARGGANYLEQLATDTIMPATGGEVRALDTIPGVRGSLPVSADARYAWVPFYRRSGTPADPTQTDAKGNWSSVAQVYMIPIAVRTGQIFDKGIPPTIQMPPIPIAANPPINAFTKYGVPALVANIVDSTSTANALVTKVDYIEFPATLGQNDDTTTHGGYTAVAEGSYVIIASAPPQNGLPAPAATITDPLGVSARVGHIFRIGNPASVQPTADPYPRRWELVPGYDYVPLANQDYDNPPDGLINKAWEISGPLILKNVSVFVIGRSLTDPSKAFNATGSGSPVNLRDGNGQDVTAYTTFVNVH